MKIGKRQRATTLPAGIVPMCGADIELANFIAGEQQVGGTGYEASRALLAEIKGLPIRQNAYSLGDGWGAAYPSVRAGTNTSAGAYAATSGWSYNLQEMARRFLAGNGGSAYLDLDHCELVIPEVLSAFDHLAAWHSMLAIARGALDRANEGRDPDRRIQVLVNNTDGLGHSYGSHISLLVSRRTFENIFSRKPHYLQFLASFQVSSILLTGQGKVGSENGRPYAPYQISQRADFFESLQGVQTTFNRPIVNARDEALCGRGGISDPLSPARLHVIFHDSSLAHGSCLMRAGLMQIAVTLLEAGLVNPRLLDDPLAAVQIFSHDPTLKARATLISGQRLTMLELQCAYLDEVKRQAARGLFEGIVPRFEEIIALWEDSLNKFIEGDLMALAPRLDWVMKLMAIERAMEQNAALDWDSPEIKMIDHLYSSLDDDGLYRAYEASGFIERLVPQERIDYFVTNPPENTRAWTRAMLLRRALNDDIEVESVDWDRMTFKVRGRYAWKSFRTFEMANPLSFTRAEAQPIFDSCQEFGDLLDGLEALAFDAELPAHEIAVN